MEKNCRYCDKKLEIKTKYTMSGHLARCKKFQSWVDSILTYEFLYDEYWIKKKSPRQISEENNFPPEVKIHFRLRKLNMPTRSVSESHQTDLYKEKIETTNLQIYGAKNPLCRGTTAFEKRNNTVKNIYGVDNVFQNKKVKEKIRKSGAFKSLFPNYNQNAIPIIEEYGRKHGYNFRHAENGGEYHIEELGYWLDGYDAEKNVAIEIDESHHFEKNGKLRKKDIDRQRKIEKLLGCKFIRIRYED